MKKDSIRLAAIVLVILLFIGAWVTLFRNSAEEANIYNSFLTTARSKNELKLFHEADDNYLAALNEKDSLELRKEIAEFYSSYGKTDKYITACEEIIRFYPHEEDGYVRMVDHYYKQEDYPACLDFIKRAEKRGLKSERLNEVKNNIKYKYEYSGLGYEEVGIFSGDMVAVKQFGGKWGYLNERGKRLISNAYIEALPFNTSGYAVVKYENNGYRIIDRNGIDKSAYKNDRNITDCGFLGENKIPVKYNGKYHYCDFEFKELFGEFDYAGSFSGGIAAVMNGGKWFFINDQGQKINEQTYEEIVLDRKGIGVRNGVAFVKKNGKYMLVDTAGNKIGNESWDNVDAFTSDQPAAVFNGKKWGFVNNKGEIVVAYKYSSARSFSNGYAAVAEKDLWGFINEKGEVIIDYSYKDALYFSKRGTVFVTKGNGWDLIKFYLYE